MSNAISVRDPWALIPSLGHLDAYISAVNRLPMLTADEEQRYAGIDFEISSISSFGNNSYNPPRTFGFELTYKFEPKQSEAPAVAYTPPPVQAPAPAPRR